MKKSKRRQTKMRIHQYTLDHEEFHALTDLLFEVLKENNTACARVLGIAPQTWRRWETDPPRMPHWPIVLRYVIKELLRSIVAKRAGVSKIHQRRMMDALSQIPQSTQFSEEISNDAYQEAESVLHLRHLLQRGGMFWDSIRLPANSGGFSRATLRIAAARLNVVKTQEGFGDSKRSFWRLPGPDDD